MSPEEHERFVMAGLAARQIVSGSREHVLMVTQKLPEWVDSAPEPSSFGEDSSTARNGRHRQAFRSQIERVQSVGNTLRSHMEGMHLLLQHDTLYSLPAISIARSVTEISASSAWTLLQGITADERAVRG